MGRDTKIRIPIHAGIKRSANLLLSHGIIAVIVPASRAQLSGYRNRGSSASFGRVSIEFYADIFEAEMPYIQTSQFRDRCADSLDLQALCSHPIHPIGQLLDPHLGIVQFLVAES